MVVTQEPAKPLRYLEQWPKLILAQNVPMIRHRSGGSDRLATAHNVPSFALHLRFVTLVVAIRMLSLELTLQFISVKYF
jgi:hypothetical protein